MDVETLTDIEKKGEARFVEECREHLIHKRYRPQPVNRHYIPKKDGRKRR